MHNKYLQFLCFSQYQWPQSTWAERLGNCSHYSWRWNSKISLLLVVIRDYWSAFGEKTIGYSLYGDWVRTSIAYHTVVYLVLVWTLNLNDSSCEGTTVLKHQIVLKQKLIFNFSDQIVYWTKNIITMTQIFATIHLPTSESLTWQDIVHPCPKQLCQKQPDQNWTKPV